jgi:hypothetical protein
VPSRSRLPGSTRCRPFWDHPAHLHAVPWQRPGSGFRRRTWRSCRRAVAERSSSHGKSSAEYTVAAGDRSGC